MFPIQEVYIMAITKDMSIIDIVQQYPDTVDILMNAGMGCLGCAAALIDALNESIGEPAAAAQ